MLKARGDAVCTSDPCPFLSPERGVLCSATEVTRPAALGTRLARGGGLSVVSGHPRTGRRKAAGGLRGLLPVQLGWSVEVTIVLARSVALGVFAEGQL